MVEDGPFSTPAFADLARRVVLFADRGAGSDPRRLAAAGGRAVPHAAFLDAEGEVLAPYRGPWTVESLERARARVVRLAELRALTSRSPAEEVDLLVVEVELWLTSPEDARRRGDDLAAGAPERGRIDAAIADQVVLGLWYDRQPRTRDDRLALGADYYRLFEQQELRPADRVAAEAFYLLMLEHAEATRSAERYGRALDGLRAWLGDRADAAGILRPFEERLARLRRR